MAVHRRAAVLGKPISHSLSPVLHNAGYRAAGLNGWSYIAIECAEAELSALVTGLDGEWAGLSLTMPLKEVALSVASEVSPVAAAVGAANTLVRRPDGSWYADNTDVSGMVAVLREAGVREGATVAVLGAGGTARAALAASARLGARSVTVAARRAEAIERLQPVAEAVGVPMTGVSWTSAADLLATDVVISTVPKGVADPLATAAPAAAAAAAPAPAAGGAAGVGAARWGAGTVLFDAIYDPWPTPLAASAASAGLRVVSGLDLLLAQALGQFTQFTGVPAPVEAMREALLAAHRG